MEYEGRFTKWARGSRTKRINTLDPLQGMNTDEKETSQTIPLVTLAPSQAIAEVVQFYDLEPLYRPTL